MSKAFELTGQKFNKLTVISKNGKSSSGDILWKCRCDCGNEINVISTHLKSNNTKSCGCIKIIDLVGQKFGKLSVISLSSNNHYNYVSRSAVWLCKCDCGNLTNVIGNSLREGVTRSCGCLNKELKTTHGMKNTPEYQAWQGLKQRCGNSNDPSYNRYGGRGINVCERWLNSFENFYTDMGPKPSPDHSIDRYPNNNGNYEPGNCKWSTDTEQQNNRRDNIICIYEGKEHNATLLAREYNVSPKIFISRINSGWSVEDALKIPNRKS